MERFFINAFIQRFSQFGFYEPQHLVNINVRMIPSESLKNQDIVQSMRRDKFLAYYKYISQMKAGTSIVFKAEFESIGDERRILKIKVKLNIFLKLLNIGVLDL